MGRLCGLPDVSPCPYCGHKCAMRSRWAATPEYYVLCERACYQSDLCISVDLAVRMHEATCEAVDWFAWGDLPREM